MIVYCSLCDSEYFLNDIHICKTQTVTFVQQGRWWCAACRRLHIGPIPVDVEPTCQCGGAVVRVASLWDADDSA